MVAVTSFRDNSDTGSVDINIRTDQYDNIGMTITADTPEFNDYESVGITDEDEGYALARLISGVSAYIEAKN